MNEEPKTQHCGDTCGVVASMAAVFSQYVPPEQRMAEAIAAVRSGKMSQRAAAAKFDLNRDTLQRRLKQVAEIGHPTKPVAGEGESQGRITDRNDRVKQLRALAKASGLTQINGGPAGKASEKQIRTALIEAGHEVPEELAPAPTKKSAPSTPVQTDDTKQQRVPANDRLAVIPERGSEADPEHPAFADKLDLDAVRDRVNQDVQRSNRPADFKRAIELLTELDRICTDAWYRRHPEPWGHDDWAHVSSEIEALHSIVGQRAEETADDILRKGSAFTVSATALA